MEHPASLSPPQPWRMAAIVAAAIAALELFVLVIVGVAFAGKLLTSEAERAAAPAGVETQATAASGDAAPSAAVAEPAGETTPLLPRGDTSILVLNGNGVRGAAALEAERVRALRYMIAGTGNAPRTDFRRSIVMYRPGREGEAARLAKDLKVKRVAPLDGMRLRDLQGAHLALIVGG